jgi:predicted cupin superfamily sugar epimerase
VTKSVAEIISDKKGQISMSCAVLLIFDFRILNMRPPEYWISQLQLLSHPEGGFYRETYRAKENILICGLPLRFSAPRSFSTAIYFLLRSQDKSLFHRIKSDELWHFHYGSVLHIYVLTQEGLTVFKLGDDLEKGESLQAIIPANCWFGAKVVSPNTYTLSSCTVAPGFDFKDFELADRTTLLKEFPQHADVISELTN